MALRFHAQGPKGALCEPKRVPHNLRIAEALSGVNCRKCRAILDEPVGLAATMDSAVERLERLMTAGQNADA